MAPWIVIGTAVLGFFVSTTIAIEVYRLGVREGVRRAIEKSRKVWSVDDYKDLKIVQSNRPQWKCELHDGPMFEGGPSFTGLRCVLRGTERLVDVPGYLPVVVCRVQGSLDDFIRLLDKTEAEVGYVRGVALDRAHKSPGS